ncbi:hypothetical protein M0R88_15635 [Halorussus gelatinilyticus]|uniref:Uncharacterized protein n=2 Tax=Halorussus TaxID=1070314 RepID=A0A8U0IGT7_9EURY|nr:hypothetical protein [Halorussus gelatinilyticus]UPV99934.1 hypothetical protein M0R88_15635 [Halorussus gelatinilyticus]
MQEYMERDRLARLDERLERIEEQQDELLHLLRNEAAPAQTDRTHSHTDRLANLDDLEPQVRQGVKSTIEHLPDNVSESDFEQAVHKAGRTDPRTVEKYKNLLESRGILLPDPRTSSDYKWFSSPRKFALVCEQDPDLSAENIAELVDSLETLGKFSVKEYRDALPDSMADGDDLKIDEAF